MDDPRYDAVGSSLLREELFSSYLKANGAMATTISEDTGGTAHEGTGGEALAEEDEAEREKKRKARKERAVKEREEKVQAERNKLNAEIDRSRSGLNREESELEFRCAAGSGVCLTVCCARC